MNAHISYLLNLASTSIQKGDFNYAEQLLQQVKKITPKNSEVYRLLGVVYAFKRDPHEALNWVKKAIKIDPGNWLAYSNQGNLLREVNQPQAALKSYERAIALQPNYAEAHNNIGNLLQDLNQPQAALKSYERAIALQPNYAQVYNNLGNALVKLKNFDSALEAYKKAIRYGEDSGLIQSSYIGCKMQLCDWDGLDGLVKNLSEANHLGNTFRFLPFWLLPICNDPFLIKRLTQEYIDLENPPKPDLGEFPSINAHKKIKIGYFSPDFRNHPVSYLIAGVIEGHNKDRFELVGFSMGPQVMDDMRLRLETSFDQFLDVSSKSDLDVAKIARDLEIDIAVDLSGLTQGCRPSIFAYRAAPIQVSYLGYLGTMGAAYMDYMIADSIIIPPKFQNGYSEKIIYLPSFQANDRKRKISDRVFSRQELGLPSDGIVFCCFNNPYKITPSIFDAWIRILSAVDGSALILYVDVETAKNNLIDKFVSAGLDKSRLIFVDAIPYQEYLARYRVADLFLDTSPYNAGTTASDALWAGLPVLTFPGNTFPSRMGASLLAAIGLHELVASSQAGYEEAAIALAKNPKKLKEIKIKLEENRLTTALFDTQIFVHHLELAYKEIYARYQKGLAPDHILVEKLLGAI